MSPRWEQASQAVPETATAAVGPEGAGGTPSPTASSPSPPPHGPLPPLAPLPYPAPVPAAVAAAIPNVFPPYPEMPPPPDFCPPSPTPSEDEGSSEGEEEEVKEAEKPIRVPTVHMNPCPLGQDGAPDYLPVDHNLPQLLRQVTGAGDLASVQSLRLRVLARETSLQRLCLYMPRLRELRLDGSHLNSLRDLGCGLKSLHILSVAGCALDSLDGTFGLTSLRELHAMDNKIDDVSMCTSLPNIKIVDLTRNLVADISYVGFLFICAELESLSLAGCPVAQMPRYRSALRTMIPQLKYIDGILLDDRERGARSSGYSEDEANAGSDRDPYSDSEDRLSSAGISGEEGTPRESGSSFHNGSMANHAGSPPRRAHRTPDLPPPGIPNPGLPTPGLPIPGLPASHAAFAPDGAAPASVFASAPARAGPAAYYSFDAGAGVSRASTPFTSQMNASRSCGSKRKKRDPASAPSRPLSASSTASEVSAAGAPALLAKDSPSPLTSGAVVCGSIARVLRSRRSRLAAWPEEAPEAEGGGEGEACGAAAPTADAARHRGSSRHNVRSSAPQTFFPHEGGDSYSGGDEAEDEAEDEADEEEEDVLNTSRRWRQMYAAYRQEHRDKWQREAAEDEEGNLKKTDNAPKKQAEREEVKTKGKEEPSEKERKKEKKQPRKTHSANDSNLPQCCRMMRMWKPHRGSTRDDDDGDTYECAPEPTSSVSGRGGSMRF